MCTFLGECVVPRESKQYAQIFVEWTLCIGGRNGGVEVGQEWYRTPYNSIAFEWELCFIPF